MKKFLIVLVVLVLSMVCFPKTVNAKRVDKQKVRNYVTTHYGKRWHIKYVYWTNPTVIHRTKYAKRKTIVVSVEISKSSGIKDPCNGMYYGKIPKTHYRCWYNKKVKKGKKVTQYIIYNPYNNEPDDILAVVDNGLVR